MQFFINNNARFCCQIKEKTLSTNAFRRMQIWTKKDKNGINLIDDDLEKSSSDDTDNEDDND